MTGNAIEELSRMRPDLDGQILDLCQLVMGSQRPERYGDPVILVRRLLPSVLDYCRKRVEETQ